MLGMNQLDLANTINQERFCDLLRLKRTRKSRR
jgi:hypothetical protein